MNLQNEWSGKSVWSTDVSRDARYLLSAARSEYEFDVNETVVCGRWRVRSWTPAVVLMVFAISAGAASADPAAVPTEPGPAPAETQPKRETTPPGAPPRRAISAHDDDTPPVRGSSQGGIASSALPARPARKFNLLLRGSRDFGGETIVDMRMVDGSHKLLTAGQGFTFAAGFLRQSASWALEATAGYKFASMNILDGKVRFSRWPFDVVVSVAGGRHRVGVGGTVHLAPTFTCEVSRVCNGEVELDTAVGAIAQYAYSILSADKRGLDIAARYTYIKYSQGGPENIDGSSFGLVLGARL